MVVNYIFIIYYRKQKQDSIEESCRLHHMQSSTVIIHMRFYKSLHVF